MSSQVMLDPNGFDNFRNLSTAATVSDLLSGDIPVVASTRGFATLTGFSEQEVLGLNCLFLTEQVPADLIDKDDESKCKTFLAQCRTAAVTGTPVIQRGGTEHAQRPWVHLGRSEVLCIQVHMKKAGELFRAMVHMKSISLEERPYILTTLLEIEPLALVQEPMEAPSAGASRAGGYEDPVKAKGQPSGKKSERPSRAGARRPLRESGSGRRAQGVGGGDDGEEDGDGGRDEREHDGLVSSSSSDSAERRAREERQKRAARRKKRDQRAADASKPDEEETKAAAKQEQQLKEKATASSSAAAESLGVKEPTQVKAPKGPAPELCERVYNNLSEDVTLSEVALARSFWYSAPIRRQGAPKTFLPLVGSGIGGSMMWGAGGFQSQLTKLAKQQTLSSSSRTSSPCSSPDEFPASTMLPTTGGRAAGIGRLHSFTTVQDTPLSGTGSLGTDFHWDKQISSASDASTAFPESVWSKQTTCEEEEEEWAVWTPPGALPPEDLHEAFDPAEVRPWMSQKFELMHKLQDAIRNQGSVSLMRQVGSDELVAVKTMPNTWVKESHEAFVAAHPEETENPWRDLGCTAFLDSVGFPHSIGLLGVFRDDKNTSIVTNFASRGDLFSWAQELDVPVGPEREKIVKPIARQLARSIQNLHNMSIMHRDLSLENVLLSPDKNGKNTVKVIDYGVAVTTRHLQHEPVGKMSYRAPEVFDCHRTCDAYLVDAFAFGVMLFCISVLDYPWMDTEGAGDRCFRFIQTKGFHAFLAKRKLPNSHKKLSEVVSRELADLLAGLLEFDPARRLTLGESAWQGTQRQSVWDAAWFQ
mmetsp:Transcript_34870/g.81497  ORF Transcript_34870/g.81497 Transcript_34870/m.81497 type:complete len:814 (+) Transcript_34870:173-2614(+)